MGIYYLKSSKVITNTEPKGHKAIEKSRKTGNFLGKAIVSKSISFAKFRC